ncbi:MAG TPA: type II toxin-antitoxin system PemK/MazF family toxin [Egibacteraceae bacterium]|nr:type II toxin-antitoxin system PemK/MazF family toxin [Egibacteraceae bacterium]
MRRGEIWWAEVAETGRRPFLVMTRDAAIPVLRTVLAVPVTKTVRGIPTELALGREDGMPLDCAAAFDNLHVVPKAYLVERITHLAPARMHEACVAARCAMDCD